MSDNIFIVFLIILPIIIFYFGKRQENKIIKKYKCKHEWETALSRYEVNDPHNIYPVKEYRFLSRCRKCHGYRNL